MPLSLDNPYLCGIPIHGIEKHLSTLHDKGYEVMIYDQHADDPKKDRVYKGTYTDNMRMPFDEEEGSSSDRRVFSATLERYPVRSGRITQYRYLLAVGYVEMNTGRVFLRESDHDDVLRAVDEFLLTFQPEEMVLALLHVDDAETVAIESTLKKSCRVISDTASWTVAEEIHYFRTAFSVPPCEDDAVVHLGLHRHPLLVECLGRLLRVLRKHDPLLMQKLRVPEFLPCHNVMRFNQDALTELNVFSICDRRRFAVDKKKQRSLLDILSRGMNVMGRRSLEKTLRSPLCDAAEIQQRYRRFRDIVATGSNDDIRDDMSHWVDVEWYLLRWRRGKLSVRLLGQLLQTYQTIRPCVPGVWLEMGDALQAIAEEWDVDKMVLGTDLSFLKVLSGNRDFTREKKAVWDQASVFVMRYQPEAKIEKSEGRLVLQLKPKQWKGPGHGFFEVHKTKSYVHVSHPEWEALATAYERLEADQQKAYEDHYRDTSSLFLERFGDSFQAFNEAVARFSCEYPLACFFRENGYTEPTVVAPGEKDDTAASSFVECTEFRHAIMEKIHPDSLFVPYSCALGLEDTPRGLLIYGINSSGKSTMLKSMGLCLWMAQCGLFVPAASMRYAPFDALYTKIGIQDNLFLGHSTFVAEMNELRYMLERATPRSFIMCDELTSGTETQSATGIVVATLLHFLVKHVCFFFTTHLHTVSKIPEVAGHKGLKTCHFRIDTKTEEILVKNIRLRYDRSLHDGSGDDLYGIEIAKKVGLPPVFLQQAFSYRDRVSVVVRGPEEKIQVSRYNKRFVLTECALCGSKDHLHTHHITPQSEFVPGKKNIHPKNGLYNLMALCEGCHENLHHSPTLKKAVVV